MRVLVRCLPVAFLMLLVNAMPIEGVHADTGPDISGHAASDAFEIVGNKANAGELADQPVSQGATGVLYVAYRWASTCGGLNAANLDCGAARTCPDPLEHRWRLWGQRSAGTWDPLETRCFDAPPTAAQTPKPQVTPGLVLNAIRRIGLPQLSVHIQPQGKTLVNFDTNFYVDPQQFNRTLTLLGQSVDVEATPTGYTWLHGDGTSATTTDPGAPYPELAVTYAYPTAATVAPSVQVTYTARFRVGGGAWQQIPGTVTVDGPPTNLLVVEGTGVLSGEH